MPQYPDSWKYSATTGWTKPTPPMPDEKPDEPKPVKAKKPRPRKGKGTARTSA